MMTPRKEDLLMLFEREFQKAIEMADVLHLQGFQTDFATALLMTAAPVFRILEDCDNKVHEEAETISQRLLEQKMAFDKWVQAFPPVQNKK